MAFAYAWAVLLQRFSGGRIRLMWYGLFAQPLQASRANAPRPDPRWAARECTRDDPIIGQFPRPKEVVVGRFAAGARCFVLQREETFVGHIWIQQGHYVEDDILCEFVLHPAAESVWDFDVYVRPEHRAGRALARLWSATEQQLAAEGKRWTLSRIERFNHGSILAHRRLGAVDVGGVVALQLGAWQAIASRSRRWPRLSRRGGRPPKVPVRAPDASAPGGQR